MQTFRRSVSRWGIGPALLAVTLILASCGTDDSGGGGDTTDTEGPAPEGEAITIGVLASLTGGYDEFKPAKQVAEAWAKWVNAEGGIEGHPVKILVEDDQLSATVTASAARKLVDGGAQAVVISSPLSNGINDKFFADSGVPVIGGSAFDRVFGSGEQAFYVTTETQAPLPVVFAIEAFKAVGATSVSTVFCGEAPSCLDAVKTYEAYSPEVGIDFKGYAQVTQTQPSLTAPCLTLKDQGAEALSMGIPGSVIQKLIPACIAQGYTSKYYGLQAWREGNIDLMTGLIGDDSQIVTSISAFPWWADSPAAQQYRDVIEEYEPETEQGQFTTTTWTALELFRKAMTGQLPAAEDAVTSDDIKNAYLSVKDETLDGLLPTPITVGEEGNDEPVNCFWMVTADKSGELGILPPEGESGNGESGDLATTCLPMLSLG